MPIYKTRGPGGEEGMVFLCGGRREKLKPCVVCGGVATLLCDGRRTGQRRTCDAPLCDRCSVQFRMPEQDELPDDQGWRIVDLIPKTRDYCPDCAPEPERDLKALTVRAPWAWLIAHGFKPIENRDWSPAEMELPQGAAFAIHQGKQWDQAGEDWVRERFPSVVFPTQEGMAAAGQLGAIIGVAQYAGFVSDPEDLFPDLAARDWFFGPLAWRLELAQPLFQPVPARGYQKLWNLRGADLDAVLKQLRADKCGT